MSVEEIGINNVACLLGKEIDILTAGPCKFI